MSLLLLGNQEKEIKYIKLNYMCGVTAYYLFISRVHGKYLLLQNLYILMAFKYCKEH